MHGDPGPANVRLDDDRRVALLDWDEARVDCPWFDLAWEAANGWTIEPNYARWRLELLDAYRVSR